VWILFNYLGFASAVWKKQKTPDLVVCNDLPMVESKKSP